MAQKDPEVLFRAFLNEREATGRTALFTAVEVNRPKAVETLLAFKADPNIPNDAGITPLQFACEKGYQTCIRVLIRGGCRASITTTKDDLLTMIWDSITNLDERAEVMAYLLVHGAIISEEQLAALLNKIPAENRPTYDKAVAEARKLRAANLSHALNNDTVPLPTSTDPAQAAPMDTVAAFAGFNTPLD